nr:S24/S26 family peptidase [Desulfospira joergensenii]
MDAVLAADPSNRVKVKGHGLSMSPFIRDHNVIVLKPNTSDTQIKFGDIVAIFNKDQTRILIHRVIGKNKNRILIKGDNNIRPDGWYSKQDVLGIVDGIIGKGLIFKYTPLVNIPAAIGSRTGLFNRILFPVLKHLKKIILPHG